MAILSMMREALIRCCMKKFCLIVLPLIVSIKGFKQWPLILRPNFTKNVWIAQLFRHCKLCPKPFQQRLQNVCSSHQIKFFCPSSSPPLSFLYRHIRTHTFYFKNVSSYILLIIFRQCSQLVTVILYAPINVQAPVKGYLASYITSYNFLKMHYVT